VPKRDDGLSVDVKYSMCGVVCENIVIEGLKLQYD